MNLSAIKALTGAGKFCTVMNAPDGKQWVTYQPPQDAPPPASLWDWSK